MSAIFLNLIINQCKSVFNGDIRVESDVNLISPISNEEPEIDKVKFFIAIESKYENNFVDVPFNHHQSSLYQLMRWISTSLFSGRNRTNTLRATIDITNKCPYSEIPDVENLKDKGKHTLRFTILSDTVCTSSVSCDSLFSCYTPSIIGSRSLNVEGFQGTSNIGVNKYPYKFITDQGNKIWSH